MIFFYHYNKPASQKAGKPQLTIHFRKTCYLVDGIVCLAKTWSHNRNSQPRLVIKGKAQEIKIKDKVAYIK
jgi:hypothetical protein